jgi:hypothetical protein
MDEVLPSLAIEHGSDVKSATDENRDVAPLDALKAVNDEHIRCSRPVDDTVHQEDAPHVEERKGLVIGRGKVKIACTKRNERPGTFTQAIKGTDDAPAFNAERDEHQVTFTQSAAGTISAPVFHVKEKDSATPRVSKQRAAHVTLPPVV